MASSEAAEGGVVFLAFGRFPVRPGGPDCFPQDAWLPVDLPHVGLVLKCVRVVAGGGMVCRAVR